MKSKSLPARATMVVPENFKFEDVFSEWELSGTESENLKNASYYILHALSRHKGMPYYLSKLEEDGFIVYLLRSCFKTC